MRRKQLLILAGVLAAVAVCLTAWRLALGHGPAADPGTAERLALAARWMLVPAFCLLAGIGMTANRRFLSAEQIDGGGAPAGSAFDINLRYNLNTLEQTVLAAVAWTGLALSLKSENLSLIPVMAGLFGVGRIAFWIGYLMAPWARAFGLGLTFYPTAVALVWLAIRALG
jgi:hypothetical protein